MKLSQAIKQFKSADTYKNQGSIHWFVWLLENPNSPIAMAGAVDLYNHDIIHILLDRGMNTKDEAMVIGFTMGNSDTTSEWVKLLFLFCAKWLYPDGYRFLEDEIIEYERGYAYGQSLKRRNIHLETFNTSEDIRDIRKRFGINYIETRN